jgi:hypothetical protein
MNSMGSLNEQIARISISHLNIGEELDGNQQNSG